MIDGAERSLDANPSATRKGVKVLDVTWDHNSDFLMFWSLGSIYSSSWPTKRSVVSLHDWLNLRSAWVSGTCYHQVQDSVPEALPVKVELGLQPIWGAVALKVWRLLLADLKSSLPIVIPQSYKLMSQKEVHPQYTLCGFCNASVWAYAAVIYLVVDIRCQPRSEVSSCQN